MAQVTITRITPSKITFTFGNATYSMEGEAGFVHRDDTPDYSAYTSSMRQIEPETSVSVLSPADKAIILQGLTQQMAERKMTISFE